MPKTIASGYSVSSIFPFQVSVRANPSDLTGNTFQAMVEVNSDLLLSPGMSSNFLSITGLGVWFTFINNDVIALYIIVSGGIPISATIQSYGMGSTSFNPTENAWSSDDDSYVFDDGGTPPAQIGINILIAYSTPDLTGKPFLIQVQTENILLEQGVIEGRPALYDFSHRRRYGITAPGV